MNHVFAGVCCVGGLWGSVAAVTCKASNDVSCTFIHGHPIQTSCGACHTMLLDRPVCVLEAGWPLIEVTAACGTSVISHKVAITEPLCTIDSFDVRAIDTAGEQCNLAQVKFISCGHGCVGIYHVCHDLSVHVVTDFHALMLVMS